LADNVTDLSKLKASMEFMSGASKNYRTKVKEQKIKRDALALEPQETISPLFNTNGDTNPSLPT